MEIDERYQEFFRNIILKDELSTPLMRAIVMGQSIEFTEDVVRSINNRTRTGDTVFMLLALFPVASDLLHQMFEAGLDPCIFGLHSNVVNLLYMAFNTDYSTYLLPRIRLASTDVIWEDGGCMLHYCSHYTSMQNFHTLFHLKKNTQDLRTAINMRDHKGRTPLVKIFTQIYKEPISFIIAFAKLLICHGADIFIPDNDGHNAIWHSAVPIDNSRIKSHEICFLSKWYSAIQSLPRVVIADILKITCSNA